MSVLESTLTRDDASIIGKTISAEVIEGFLYGMECIFFVAALYKLFCRGLRNSTPRRILLMIIVIIFLCSAGTIIFNVFQYVVQITALGDPEYNFGPAKLKANIVSTFTTRINYLLGDVVVVWRAWILFSGQTYFRLILVACFLSTFSSIVINVVFSVKLLLEPSFGLKPGPRMILPATLLCTNIVATIFSIYRAWHYYRFIKRHLSFRDRKERSQVEKILILLVVSGILYTFLWINDIIAYTNPQLYNFSVYFMPILPHVVGIYPTAIVVLTDYL